MMRSNVDVIAVSVLIAAAAIGSWAQKIVVRDVFSNRSVVLMERATHGPVIKVVSLLPLFPCLRN